MKTLRAKKRGAAGWCESNGIGPGDRVEVLAFRNWVPATVTALGQSAILARQKGCAEFALQEPTKLRLAHATPQAHAEAATSLNDPLDLTDTEFVGERGYEGDV